MKLKVKGKVPDPKTEKRENLGVVSRELRRALFVLLTPRLALH
jgi:hypothetical protein